MTPPFFHTHPRACAVILASSQVKGSRLFPVTTAEHPKHSLPVAGVPSILRLLNGQSPLSAFSQIVIAIAANDTRTVPILVGGGDDDGTVGDDEDSPSKDAAAVATLESQQDDRWKLSSNQVKGQTIYVIRLSEKCFGPIDALRQVESTKTIHPKTRIVVFPGDLVFLNSNGSSNNKNGNILDALIRPPSNSACVSMLVDVLEQDEHGNTLKESAKVRISLEFFCGQLRVSNIPWAHILPRLCFFCFSRPRKEDCLGMKKILNTSPCHSHRIPGRNHRTIPTSNFRRSSSRSKRKR